MDLPQQLYDQIELLSNDGNDFEEQGQFAQAITAWTQARDLLPDPKDDWEAYTWLSASIGDAHFQLGELPAAREALFDALNGPDGQENPFIHYRLGQTTIALGNEEGGIAELLKAYMLDGETIFLEDDDGPALLQLLKSKKIIDK